MNGNKTQYDPSEMFREWIQKSGKAQAEFMRNFGAMMGQPAQSFDPLQTLKEIAEKTSETQTNFMENFSSMQTQGLNKMFNLSQMMPNFLQWGAYKTSVGTNGRISIPEAERAALGLKEGDLVQVIVLPLEKKSKRR
ncbi:MAG: AbrB/MazE/SpoVT family DNA-binding domain-containing protein [Nitrosopumilaceae archaeon]|jgi:AbrB family looped-hinge helix DNA binding protein